MTEQQPPSRWRLPVVLLVVIMAINLPLLAIVAWILLSGAQRKVYWQTWWVKGGLGVGVIGALPLLAVGIAGELGLGPPNPNPIGLGLLFLFSEVLGSLMAIFGLLRTHFKARKA